LEEEDKSPISLQVAENNVVEKRNRESKISLYKVFTIDSLDIYKFTAPIKRAQ